VSITKPTEIEKKQASIVLSTKSLEHLTFLEDNQAFYFIGEVSFYFTMVSEKKVPLQDNKNSTFVSQE